jgi:hypothetical protein
MSELVQKLDEVVAATLSEFAAWVARSRWYGREHEAVSAYAMGFLVPACEKGCVLHTPAQIGIEAAVPQLDEPRRKRAVCKDLVIWREPFGNTWNGQTASKHPISVIEWKRASCAREAAGDREWLRSYSLTVASPFVGYSVVFDTRALHGVVKVARVAFGSVDANWLSSPA